MVKNFILKLMCKVFDRKHHVVDMETLDRNGRHYHVVCKHCGLDWTE